MSNECATRGGCDMSEIAWGWPEIAIIIAWKLAPKGFVMRTEDLVSLPRDRVLIEKRTAKRLVLSFVALDIAHALKAPEYGTESASVSELQGRWQKIAVCTLWHFARRGKLGKKDSVTLTQWDKAQVPADVKLMASGHAQGVEWRFLPRGEADSIAKWDEENEGAMIEERTQL